jgi:tetratricopeptide (TPR) repeat protein
MNKNKKKNTCIVTVMVLFFLCCGWLSLPAEAYSLDLKKTENYFYDKFYPDCNADVKVIENYDFAVRAFEKKDIIKALFYLNNVLEYSQFSKEALNLYGVVLMYEGDFENARELFRSSINHGAGYKWPYINLGLINFRLERWRALEEVSASYLSCDADDFEANLGMGIAAFHLFCYQDADRYLKTAYNFNKNAASEDFVKVLNDYRARVRAKLRRLY